MTFLPVRDEGDISTCDSSICRHTRSRDHRNEGQEDEGDISPCDSSISRHTHSHDHRNEGQEDAMTDFSLL